MHRKLQEFESAAMKLPVEDRGELATKLLDSLEASDSENQERWIGEAERRAEEMRSAEHAASRSAMY